MTLNRTHLIKSVLFCLTVATLSIQATMAQLEPESNQPEPQVNKPLEPAQSAVMTVAKIKKIINEIAEEVKEEENGNLSFYYNGATLVLLSDSAANRMRIVSPVIEANRLTQEHIIASLISNYHLALDARYAIGDGILYSVYIHPLKELTETQLLSAVRQVATLKNTFGNGYTSGEMSFGVEEPQERIDL